MSSKKSSSAESGSKAGGSSGASGSSSHASGSKSSTSVSSVSKLVIRNLDYHERMAEKMFNFSSFDLSAKRASIERKILDLEAAILEIPDDGEKATEDLFELWFGKVGQLRERLFLLSDVVSSQTPVDAKAPTSSGSISQISADAPELYFSIVQVLAIEKIDQNTLPTLNLLLDTINRRGQVLDHSSLSLVSSAVFDLLKGQKTLKVQRGLLALLTELMQGLASN